MTLSSTHTHIGRQKAARDFQVQKRQPSSRQRRALRGVGAVTDALVQHSRTLVLVLVVVVVWRTNVHVEVQLGGSCWLGYQFL